MRVHRDTASIQPSAWLALHIDYQTVTGTHEVPINWDDYGYPRELRCV